MATLLSRCFDRLSSMFIAAPVHARHNKFARYTKICTHVDASSSQIGRAQCAHVAIKIRALAATKNDVAVTSRWIFSCTFCGGQARVRARRWNNIWPFAAVDFHQVIQLCCAIRACLRSSPLHTWCKRPARRPSCIIQIALSLSVCAVITSADVFVTERLASYTVDQMA